jgi:hypothetical protein
MVSFLPLYCIQPSVRTHEDLKLKVSKNGQRQAFLLPGRHCLAACPAICKEEVDEYLKDWAIKGFTVVQSYVLRGLEVKHSDGAKSILGEGPLIDRDPTKPNEAFFKNVDAAVNRANELGLAMGLATAKSWHINKLPEQVFDANNAYLFGKILGALQEQRRKLVRCRRLTPRRLRSETPGILRADGYRCKPVLQRFVILYLKPIQ